MLMLMIFLCNVCSANGLVMTFFLLVLLGTLSHPNRCREEIEKQKAKAHYMKLHYAGKTDEAKADLARLAIIRREREEAARKKEGEKKGNQVKQASLVFFI